MTFATLFCLMFMGHLVGDYLLQNQWMAINKSGKGWLGHLTCTVHVAIYTLAMCTFLHMFRFGFHWYNVQIILAWLMALGLVFFGRFNQKKATIVLLFLLYHMARSLTHPWLVAAIAVPHWLIDRTSFAAIFLKWKNGFKMWDILQANETNVGPKQVWEVAFSAPVYIVNDNAMHFLLMLPILYWLGR